MSKDLFTGELVRLDAPDPENEASLYARWQRDSEYMRLLDADALPLFTARQHKEGMEEELKNPKAFIFSIRTIADDRLIGFVALDGVNWNHGDTFVGIGLGEREFWGQGYGTEAMELVLQYAFTELNLHRVSLNVFEYNPRAIRSYEKAGFRVEGRQRQAFEREGRRWDAIYMGILREEWEQKHERTGL